MSTHAAVRERVTAGLWEADVDRRRRNFRVNGGRCGAGGAVRQRRSRRVTEPREAQGGGDQETSAKGWDGAGGPRAGSMLWVTRSRTRQRTFDARCAIRHNAYVIQCTCGRLRRLSPMVMYNPPHPGEFIREVYLEPNAFTGRQLAKNASIAGSIYNNHQQGRLAGGSTSLCEM